MKYTDIVKKRRSIRVLTKDPNFDKIKVQKMIEESMFNSPSGYSMNAGRIVLLFDAESNKFWDNVYNMLSKEMDEERALTFRKKIDGFKNGNGTALFFDDRDVVEKLKENVPLFAAAMDEWSVISQGILEYVVWTGFTNMDIAASLQHYNPVVDEMVQQNWGVPKEWKLYAQMPFGVAAQTPKEKPPLDYSIRLKIFG